MNIPVFFYRLTFTSIIAMMTEGKTTSFTGPPKTNFAASANSSGVRDHLPKKQEYLMIHLSALDSCDDDVMDEEEDVDDGCQ